MLSEDELRLFRKLYGNCEVTLRYFILTKKNPYISCFITDFQDISSWNCTEPVFISAQTGTGKNYFIQHTLVNYVNQQNIANNFYGKILLLSNRVALTRQGKKQLAGNLIDVVGDNKPFKKMTGYTDEGLDNYTNFNIVEVLSYHQLYNRLLIPEECEKLNKRNFKYIIFDECHFFTSDATTFNRNTQFILRHCIETFKDSIRIYMSATLEEAFSPIIRAESKFGTNTKISGTVHCLYYYFARNYNYINEPINVYSDLMSLPEYIQGRSPDKWIVFVSSKKDGGSLVEKLHEQGIKAVFLSADSKETSSKEYTTYKGIVEEEKFPQQVLVATSVLDNGINIKDPDVKHIVIDVLDRTEFVQMLGRVRISGDQEIKLYIRHYSDENIKKFFMNDVKALLARLHTDFIKNDVRTDYYQNLPDSKYKKEHLFRLTAGKRQFKYNKCAIYKLLERTITFLRVLNVNTLRGCW